MKNNILTETVLAAIKVTKYNSTIDEARAIAAQCWCDIDTENKVMDVELAEAFAKRIEILLNIINRKGVTMKFSKTEDNHLEHMGKFKNDAYLLKMQEFRQEFIKLDNKLRDFIEHEENVHAAYRTIALSRTHLETSLQYAIKTICILGSK